MFVKQAFAALEAPAADPADVVGAKLTQSTLAWLHGVACCPAAAWLGALPAARMLWRLDGDLPRAQQLRLGLLKVLRATAGL